MSPSKLCDICIMPYRQYFSYVTAVKGREVIDNVFDKCYSDAASFNSQKLSNGDYYNKYLRMTNRKETFLRTRSNSHCRWSPMLLFIDDLFLLWKITRYLSSFCIGYLNPSYLAIHIIFVLIVFNRSHERGS